MCIVTLSVLEKCHHELATIDYCPSAEPDEADGEENSEAGEESTTQMPCTDSLGWEIYTSLDAKVTCKSCKAWLKEQGKQTYGEIIEESPEDAEEGKAGATSSIEGPPRRKLASYVWTKNGPVLPGSPAHKLKSKGS